MSPAPTEQATDAPSKRHESLAFLFLALVLFPVLAIVLVGGFGFVIWMQHLMFGPPGI